MVTRGRAFEAFERALNQLAADAREPTTWEETNYLEAVTAIVAGDYQTVIDRIADAQRLPTPAELTEIRMRQLQTKEDLRQRVEGFTGVPI